MKMTDALKIDIDKIRVEHIGKKLKVHGKATRVGTHYLEFKTAAFQCMRCGYITKVEQDQDQVLLQEPICGCENDTCGKKGPFKILSEESELLNVQDITILEIPENPKNGQIIKTLQGRLYGDAICVAQENEIWDFIGELTFTDKGKKRHEFFLKITELGDKYSSR